MAQQTWVTAVAAGKSVALVDIGDRWPEIAQLIEALTPDVRWQARQLPTEYPAGNWIVVRRQRMCTSCELPAPEESHYEVIIRASDFLTPLAYDLTERINLWEL